MILPFPLVFFPVRLNLNPVQFNKKTNSTSWTVDFTNKTEDLLTGQLVLLQVLLLLQTLRVYMFIENILVEDMRPRLRSHLQPSPTFSINIVEPSSGFSIMDCYFLR